ncbi:MAG TPA: Uma2 family endonuclease [Thermoanaerobaculia bacterium]|nr:Uma2 family endonuclease [Thermoanaerobaculia bacterium]
MTATATKLTYDDYVKLPDDGKRYEIIDGELFVNPAPVPGHQLIVLTLASTLRAYCKERGGGKVLVSPIDVVFADDRIVQPDVVVILAARASIVGKKNVQGRPHLVVEVLSDGTRRYDEIQKRRLYESAGVEEYWVVDPEIERVKIYRLSGGKYVLAAEIDTDNGGNITSPLLPEFALPIADVFAE